MKRGEIYYIDLKPLAETFGHEMAKARPGIIVSVDDINRLNFNHTVVYLTTKDKPDKPWYVPINSARLNSTAVCDQVDTVTNDRVGDYCGTCTEEELAAVEEGIRLALGLKEEAPKTRSQIERDIYKTLYEKLLERSIK